MKKITLLLIIILLFTGCSKKAMTTEEFSKQMTSKGYKVSNSIDDFASGILKEAYMASNDNYNIEFYVTDTLNQALYSYKFSRKIFKQEMSSDTISYESIKDNHGKYYYKSGNQFKLISLIDNTYIYVEADTKYSNEILKIVSFLGY